MKVKHYVTIFSDKNVIPTQKTVRVDSSDVKKLTLAKDVYRVVTFDRYVGSVEVKGKKIQVASQKINQKLYHIGKYQPLDLLSKKDPFFVELAKAGDCIGMVTSPNGMETLVFRGEGIIDPLNKEDIIVRESVTAQKIDTENVKEKQTKPATEKKHSETAM